MNKEQFDEIINSLTKWREERHLTTEHQRVGYLGNMFEEITEYVRATNDEEKIDAICDMLVFTINSYQINYADITKTNTENINVPKRVISMMFRSAYNELVRYLFTILQNAYDCNPYLCMMETIKEISSRTGRWNDELKKFVKDNGLYPEDVDRLKKCMTIEDESNEWITFADGMDSYTYKKWYKADYTKCKKDK